MSAPVSQRIRASVPPRPAGPPPKKESKWIRRIFFGWRSWASPRWRLVLVKFGMRAGPMLSFKRGETYELLSRRCRAGAPRSIFLFLTGRSLADLPWPQRVFSWISRTAFVALLAIGLGRVAKTAYSHKVCTVYIVDVSESVPPEAISDAQPAVDKAWNNRGDGEVRVVTFATRPRVIGSTEPAEPKIPPPKIERHDAGPDRVQGADDTQAAIQLAYGLYPQGYLKRAVLYSDGVQTAGDALAEASASARLRGEALHGAVQAAGAGRGRGPRAAHASKIKVGEAFEVTQYLDQPHHEGARADVSGRSAQRPRRHPRYRSKTGETTFPSRASCGSRAR